MQLSRTTKMLLAPALLVLGLVAYKLVIGQVTLPPLTSLAAEPLYMNGAKTKANLTLAVSVEFPTVGATYRDTFDEARTYIGYFDPKVCYRHVPAGGGIGAYFDWTSATSSTGGCNGGGFNGNFMNWATSSAIDIMRYGLTGGNRVVDQDNGSAKTVVERAYLPDSFYRSGSYFPQKVLPAALVNKMIETSAANKIGNVDMYIYNCRDRVYFAKAQDTTGGCTNPFGVANAKSDNLAGPNANDTYYEVRNLVCDANSATNRLMSYDPATKKWAGLCFRYPNGKYKPVGQFQMNADNLRVSVFGYLQDDSRSRNGGVMRAPLKYLGPNQYDSGSNLMTTPNPRTEWDKTTGVFIDNPQNGDATYGAQGHPKSGAIMYINKFGTLDSANVGKYKGLDPVSELYYEALRYLQGLQPNANPVALTGTADQIKTLKEDFPVYATWTDPFAGFQDSAGTTKSCLRNSILGIADVNTHSDSTIPGNTRTTNQDSAVSATTSPAMNVETWTSIVGSYEANSGTVYTDSKGNEQKAFNIASNSPYRPGLAGAATANTGSGGTGSFYMAGLAYWANTQSYRTDIPKARVSTYSIDVNEGGANNNVDNRRQRQLYLAAKYGGFDDSLTGGSGNPYEPGSNVLWQGADGDAKNYFLVSDAQKFLDSISDVFAKIVEETGSIAGGAISTTRVSSGQSASVFQARFNPVSNYWSGRIFKYPLLVNTSNELSISDTETWEASSVITTDAKADNGAGRNIVIGSPIGQQGTIDPSPFKWADLAQLHKDALNIDLSGVVDTNGELRLNYLRGDQRQELSASNTSGIFRPRDAVLGDVVNSGLIYMGKPSTAVSGADYATFYNANLSRKAVVFANANDGMLHAIYDSNGKEAFAYIPGFLAPKLKNLPDLDYSHISLADATPAVGEAYINSTWKSVLVSGVGGGAQGVFALDVTTPETFTKNNVLWEFTDRDSAALGNVVGTPQIVKLRVEDGTSSTAFKWYAVFAGGVNNYAADGYAHSTGNPSIFILDLEAKPSTTTPWTEGVNFWRIELPQTSTAIAKGILGFNVVKNFNNGAVDQLFAGDMQGNVWALDFNKKGVSSLTATASNNLQLLNSLGSTSVAPIFIARDASSNLQPITTEPVLVNGYNGEKVISFGTGKYMEISDTSVPLTTRASFYALFYRGAAISGRSVLQAGTIASDGNITMSSFAYASRSGWYIDFNATIGERQISDISAVFGKFIFASLYPTTGACGEGGGRLYQLDALKGAGSFLESQVGILAAPLVIDVGDASVTPSDTTGRRTATQKTSIVTQGSKGLRVASSSSSSFQAGRLSWRQINNYQENKQIAY
jgi:type IV pilus assembly protein PilY1